MCVCVCVCVCDKQFMNGEWSAASIGAKYNFVSSAKMFTSTGDTGR